MSLKHIIAIATGGAGDEHALSMAGRLAREHDGVVDVLPIYPDTAADMISLGLTLGATLSPEAIEELAAAEQALQRRIEATARAAAGQADVVFGPGPGAPRLTVLTRGLRPSLAVGRHAALADLVIFAQAHVDTASGGDVFRQCLFDHRAPVLVARAGAESLAGPVAIAWDGSGQAGRAVKAALPLLAMASTIHILQCVSGLDRDTTDPDIDSLNAYLKLHGVGEGIATLVEGVDEGAALVAAAEGKGASLLVAGAWGHSRLREAVFGGATRTFLRHKQGPSLLLAH